MSQTQLPKTFMAMAISQFGDPDVLQLIEKELHMPDAGKVLIRVISASVNPIDVKTRAGIGWAAQQNADHLPMVPGYDCYGQIAAVGSTADDVTYRLNVGDHVVGMVGFPLEAGCYGQYVIADAEELVNLVGEHEPDIAALPVAGLTAWQGLFEHGQLERGDRVVISAAAGGVGLIAVQLAIDAGAEVIAVASEKNHARLLEFGVSQVIDYHKPEQFNDITDIDLWFDLIGGESALDQLSRVDKIQRLVTVPTVSAGRVCEFAKAKGCEVQGMLVHRDQPQLTHLVSLLEDHRLQLNIAKKLDFTQAARAHQLIERGQISGKIILELS